MLAAFVCLAATTALVRAVGAAPSRATVDSSEALRRSSAARTTSQSADHHLRIVQELGGIVAATAADGDRAYAALRSRVAVIDTTADPDAALLGMSAPLGTTIHALAVRDGIVVVAANDLIVLDARDPNFIRELGRASNRGIRARGATWVGDQVWLRDDQSRLVRFSIALPERPRRLQDWTDETDAAPRGEIAFVSSLGDGRVAILQLSPRGNRFVKLRILAARSDGNVDELDSSTLNFQPLGMAYRYGELVLGQDPGKAAFVPVDEAGRLGPRREVDLGFLAPRASGFGIVGEWAWFLTLFPPSIRMANLEDRSRPVVNMPLPEAASFAHNLLPVGDRIWMSMESESMWIDPARGATRGPALATSALREVEPGAVGPWAVDWQGRLVHVKSNASDVWRLAPINRVSHVHAPGEQTVRASGGWLHYTDAKGVTSIRLGAHQELLDESFKRVPSQLEPSTQSLLDVEPGRVVALRVAQTRPAESTLVIHGVESPHVVPTEPIDPVAEWGVSLDSAVLNGDEIWFTGRLGPSFMLRGAELDWGGPGRFIGNALFFRAATQLHDIDEGILVASTANRIMLLSLRDLPEPRLLEEIEFPGTIGPVARDGDRLAISWLSAQGGGLSVIDIAFPDRPEVLAETHLGAMPLDVAISQDRIWIADTALTAFALEPVEEPTAAPTTPTATNSPGSTLPATSTATPTGTSTATPTPTPPDATPTAPPFQESHRAFIPWLAR